MGWVTTEEMKKDRPRRHSTALDSEVLFAIDKRGDKSGSVEYSMRLGVPVDIVFDAGFAESDRVTIAFDSARRLGLIAKSKSGGRKMTKKHKRFVIQEMHVPGMPSVASTIGCICYRSREGIVFQLPAEASFTEQLRK